MKLNKNLLLGISLLLTLFILSYFWGYYQTLIEKNLNNYYYLNYEKELKKIETKYGLRIYYKVNKYFLPLLWMNPPYNSTATELAEQEIISFIPAIKSALKKYPKYVIRKNLEAIFLAKRIRFFNKFITGAYTEKNIYMTKQKGRNNLLLLTHIFHHEFTSILRLNYTTNDIKWKKNIPKKFKYSNDLSSLNKNDFVIPGNNNLYKQGFVSGYSRMSLDNDVSEYSRLIFSEPQKFKGLMEKYPLIRKKFEVWLEFYQSIDPIFTEEYLFGES